MSLSEGAAPRQHTYVANGILSASVKRPRTALRTGRRQGTPGLQESMSSHDAFELLAEREMLFALLCHALPWPQAASAARDLLTQFGSFAEAIAAPQAELATISSLSPTAAALLKCVHGAALRLSKASLRDALQLNCWSRLEEYLTAVMSRDRVEVARALFLDTRNRLIADEVLGHGDVRGVAIYPRQVVRRALELNATALILVHNHPSGDPTPSQDDIAMTHEVRRAAETLGIVLHDHVVVGRGKCVSLRRLGLL